MEGGYNIRMRMEKREHEILSPYASFSDCSMGRDVYEEPCDSSNLSERSIESTFQGFSEVKA